MEVTEGDIQNLRSAFFNKLSETGQSETDVFHPNDINRIKVNGDWLRRFLLHQDNDQTLALNMLWEACEWRKSFETNEISESTINMTILQDASIFPRNRDKDGKALLIFKSKKHVKGKHDFQELKRVLVYWLERLEREENGEPISVFFDMDGAGLSNMDMDNTKYILTLFKLYYPHYLNNIFIFEMPWVLNAAFKVIKTWLPPKAVEKIKFIGKSSLKDFVAPEQSLKSWGGFDDYVFEFTPEVKTPHVDAERKKVHFADKTSYPETTKNYNEVSEPSTTYKLTINPVDVIQFVPDSGETSATLRLKNDESIPMSFKIKTTAPEKFRVRPSAGLLKPGVAMSISVQLLPGYDGSGLSRDKFLVLAIPVTSEFENLSPAELWVAASKDVVQHRLRCQVPSAGGKNDGRIAGTADSDRQVTKLSNEVTALRKGIQKDLRFVKLQLWLLIILVVGLCLFIAFSSKKELCPSAPQQSCQDPSSEQIMSFVASSSRRKD